ncbi:unnamed protein product [Leptidea sinapis]|uniref:Uncharacterized protein n=1 Tax=Leptidea sinapis TaxID=189913 RepID=A0A5E4PLD6_9NEOP|nr:unnamed protein product [Leptidea sinapis]
MKTVLREGIQPDDGAEFLIFIPRAEEVVKGILSDQAYDIPSDPDTVEEADMKLPDWFDENKFKQGCRFFWDFCLPHTFSMFIGFVGAISIPTIISVLVGTQKSNTPYTAYKRYVSTYLHVLSWFSNDLKPGSVSWRSLNTVRNRHMRAGKSARLKNQGKVSQRDLALTMFGFVGFSVLNPHKFHITQLNSGDMEAYIHAWSVIGSLLGTQDRYNICRKTFDETQQVLQMLVDEMYTPCLENVPEYFEHSARVLSQVSTVFVSFVDADFLIYWTKHLCNVPGYIYTEGDRIDLQKKLRKLQNGADDIGIDSMELIHKCELATPPTRCRLLYLKDYDTVADSPAYKNLPFKSKFNMALFYVSMGFYSTFIGRHILNLYYKFLMYLAQHFPYIAILRYGFKNAFVNMFKEDDKDPTPPKLNSEYYMKNKETWYQATYNVLMLCIVCCYCFCCIASLVY